jgi:hypothetical protein
MVACLTIRGIWLQQHETSRWVRFH